MAALDDPLWASDKDELIDRIHELEGLLASTTRMLEACERELADERVLPTPLKPAEPAHLTRLDQAITRLAGLLCDDGTHMDELWTPDGNHEPRVAVIADAVMTLASARDRLTPK